MDRSGSAPGVRDRRSRHCVRATAQQLLFLGGSAMLIIETEMAFGSVLALAALYLCPAFAS